MTKLSRWVTKTDKSRYGIVIYNFMARGEHRLRLSLGETVYLISQCEDWFYGYSTRNKSVMGIFPKSYIHLLNEKHVQLLGPNEVLFVRHPHVVQEITFVLKEWGVIWKNLYIINSEHFKTIELKMRELMSYRKKIVSGTLPVDELKQLKRQITSKIDLGNRLLGLDMVVRDEHGNILNAEKTSCIQLYWQHQLAAERISKQLNERGGRWENDGFSTISATSTLGRQHAASINTAAICHTLYVCVESFVSKTTDDVQLLLALYDAKEGRPFSENCLLLKHPTQPEQINNAKVLFTDLGTRDVSRGKVYFVCYVVRVGSMDKGKMSEQCSTPSSTGPGSNQSQGVEPVRRPYGVCALDISTYFNQTSSLDLDAIIDDIKHFVPFVQCEKESNLEGTLRKILTVKELSQKEHKNQGLYVSFKMLHTAINQVREENRHLLVGQMTVARKMGFPEVILPGDVRNDLYLTLHSGEFSKGSKSTDKNVQITVTVCTESGQVLQRVMESGRQEGSEYNSVVYYHEDKPRWAETCKITVPIDEFKLSHLKFTFRHRSSNETKDRNEKPFAISYVRLMQVNGTTLPDQLHELLVYKIDTKKYDCQDTSYLNLPSTKQELFEAAMKPGQGCFSLSSKDSFLIQTCICSTKLTHNVDLLGLLNWTSRQDNLGNNLNALMKVNGEEIVKFLQDVLDSLFNILMQNTDSDEYDKMVFNCLLHIISLISDRKYQHFQPVLDVYIKESFSATLAHKKLIAVLKSLIDNANTTDQAASDVLLKTMKSLQYCIKFIVTSRQLYSKLNEDDKDDFDLLFTEMLESIARMMCYTTDATLRAQGGCLKHLPSTIPDIISVYNPIQLSTKVKEIINNLPSQRLTKQKMMTLNEVVHSPLFLQPSCRRILLPVILHHTKELLEASDENTIRHEFRCKTKSVAKAAKVLGESQSKFKESKDDQKQAELCVKILSDVMDLLFSEDAGPTLNDITEIMLSILRTVIQSTIAMDRDSHLIGNVMAVMLSILRQMSAHHFEAYINDFPTKTDLLDFLMEILLVFKDLVSRPVYSKDWCEMINLQNSILLKSLRFFSHTIRDFFSQRFEHQVWNNFFHCAISFLTQPALQLETFSPAKRWSIVSKYKDMRRETGFEIRSMWFNLGQHKIQFVPGLVGPFLEMTLIPEMELRRATIPIFFDMMQCEFYLSRDSPRSLHNYHNEASNRDSSHMKANFSLFENEMIAKLDNLVEMGKGDEQFKELFQEIMTIHCENHSTMKDQGLKFVRTISRLMEHLFEYRSIIDKENRENKMSCTVNLLDFYSEINRKEMYIRYIYKLCDLHLSCDNFTEAAYTLRLHSKLLSWSEAPLTPQLKSLRHPLATTHKALKLALYEDIKYFFNSGKMWECAVETCKELSKLYEDTDYGKLSELLREMAEFYDNIMTKLRPEPEYFRVAYYGRGFSTFMQNKVFIYRGKEYERLSDFSSRILNQLPKAELMSTLTPPGPDITESNLQLYEKTDVQINKVESLMDEKKLKQTIGKSINPQILNYHKVNNVQKFRFSRPYHKRDAAVPSVKENEFATLWLERSIVVISYPLPGILRWFPVTSTYTYHLSPLANAIETMQTTNKSLRELILVHRDEPTRPLNPLSMKLNGIVDAAVNGGINNYEKAFFTPEYLEAHEEDAEQVSHLKELIACQTPLLEVGLRLHRELAPASLQPFHQRMEHCFNQMQAHVIANYGAKTCDIKFESRLPTAPASIASSTGSLRRQSSAGDTVSIASTESRSRVSSLTKSQVAYLKTFVIANITSSPTISRSNSVHTRSPASRSISVLSTNSATNTLMGRKKKKQRRSSSSVSSKDAVDAPLSLPSVENSPVATAKWYTSGSTEGLVSQELTPVRPLRPASSTTSSSRPSSAELRQATAFICTTPTRPQSLGTESTTSEEDSIPPPLPIKQREADYCNLPDYNSVNNLYQSTPPNTPVRVRNKPVPPEPIEDMMPPVPPPKTHSLHLS